MLQLGGDVLFNIDGTNCGEQAGRAATIFGRAPSDGGTIVEEEPIKPCRALTVAAAGVWAVLKLFPECGLSEDWFCDF